MTEEEIAAIQAAAAQLGLELVEEARAAAPIIIAQDADQKADNAQDDGGFEDGSSARL